MIHVAVRALLLSNSTVSGIVGTRIHANKMPQGVPSSITPALVFRWDPGPTDYGVAKLVGPRRPSVRLTAWAMTYDACAALSDAVVLALEGFRGEQSGERINGVFFRGVRDDFDDESKVFRRDLDFEVVHRAAVAA